jgi:hypothetical protein
MGLETTVDYLIETFDFGLRRYVHEVDRSVAYIQE